MYGGIRDLASCVFSFVPPKFVRERQDRGERGGLRKPRDGAKVVLLSALPQIVCLKYGSASSITPITGLTKSGLCSVRLGVFYSPDWFTHDNPLETCFERPAIGHTWLITYILIIHTGSICIPRERCRYPARSDTPHSVLSRPIRHPCFKRRPSPTLCPRPIWTPVIKPTLHQAKSPALSCPMHFPEVCIIRTFSHQIIRLLALHKSYTDDRHIYSVLYLHNSYTSLLKSPPKPHAAWYMLISYIS